jgi:hypothetical protein
MILSDFYTRVAQRLGVLPVAGTLSADDSEVIRVSYVGLMHELIEHGLGWWNADEDVPDLYAEVLAGMTAAQFVDEFTIPEPRRSTLIMQHGFGLPQASVSERRLRALTATPYNGETGTADYF